MMAPWIGDVIGRSSKHFEVLGRNRVSRPVTLPSRRVALMTLDTLGAVPLDTLWIGGQALQESHDLALFIE